MKITIINGTNRLNSKTLKVAEMATEICENKNFETKLVTLDNFKTLFTGEYINLENANDLQKQDILNIKKSRIVIFVIPTYHHGIPASLKNFFDIINDREIYNKKVIGLIATNLGVDTIRQTRTVLDEILAYNKSISIIPPKDILIDLSDIDSNRIQDYIEYLAIFNKAFNP